jgi:hypothetical protein
VAAARKLCVHLLKNNQKLSKKPNHRSGSKSIIRLAQAHTPSKRADHLTLAMLREM